MTQFTKDFPVAEKRLSLAEIYREGAKSKSMVGLWVLAVLYLLGFAGWVCVVFLGLTSQLQPSWDSLSVIGIGVILLILSGIGVCAFGYMIWTKIRS